MESKKQNYYNPDRRGTEEKAERRGQQGFTGVKRGGITREGLTLDLGGVTREVGGARNRRETPF